MNLSDYKLQITEIYQITDNRLIVASSVCQMLPAKSLPNATRYLLNESTGWSA